MSEIRTDTISAANGTDPVTLTKQSAAKAWGQPQGNATLNDSFNISSSADNGTGDYTYTFSNAMSGTYPVSSGDAVSGNAYFCSNKSLSATAVGVAVHTSAGAAIDSWHNFTVQGDLA